MAEYMTAAETRTYALSNGETADLMALIQAFDLGDEPGVAPESVSDLHVGQIVWVWILGAKYRRGVVTKLGKTKVTVAVLTQGALDEALRYRGGENVRVANQSVQLSQVRYIPEAPAAELEQAEELLETLTEDEDKAEELAVAELIETEIDLDTLPDPDGSNTLPIPSHFFTDEAVAAAENEGMPCPAESDEEPAKPVSAPPAPGQAGSAVVTILERVWSLIREQHAELPEIVIVTGSAFIGPPRWAHHRPGGWSARQEKGAALTETPGRIAEMFVAGETLAKGAVFTLETMLHEAGHSLAGVRKVQDTSRQGRWHNAKFRQTCEELGLEWPEGKKQDAQIGYSDMMITEATKERYTKLLDELEAAIHLTISVPGFLAPTGQDGEGGRGGERIPGGRHGGKAKGSGGASSNNLKATCGCVEPRIIRASRKVLAEGAIMCGCCKEPFTLAE